MIVNVGENIRTRRKELRLNQDELAELASLNRVTIAKYESGKVEPGAQALSRIADALETTTDELVGRKTLHKVVYDEETAIIRERLRRDPSYKLLFDAASKATPEHLRAAAAMLKSLEPQEVEN